jgi:hypothetical protein
MHNPSQNPEPEQLKTAQIERSVAGERSKKSPAQKAAVPAPSLVELLKVVEHGPPFSREEFLRARSAFGLNMVLFFFGGMFAVLGLAIAFVPDRDLEQRFIGGGIAIPAGLVSWPLGRRFARQARFLACPGCKDLLSSQTSSVLQTGTCRKCGAVVLSGHPSAHSQPHQATTAQAAAPKSSPRSPSLPTRKFHRHPQRLIDIAVLFGAPAIFMLISNGLEFGQAWTVIAGLMLLGYGAIFYFFPDASHHNNHSQKSSHSSQPQAIASGISQKTPWLDYVALLFLPVAVVATLLYLAWTHTVPGKLGLGVATVAIPLAVVLLSWFVMKHEGHQVKKTGKPAPAMLMGSLLAFWIAALFIFVVCLVTWIQKFALQW